MKTKDAVRKPPGAIAAGASMAEAARLMDRRSVGALVVLDGERLVGIVTDRDLVRRGLARRLPADARIDMVMTPDSLTRPVVGPVILGRPELDVAALPDAPAFSRNGQRQEVGA